MHRIAKHKERNRQQRRTLPRYDLHGRDCVSILSGEQTALDRTVYRCVVTSLREESLATAALPIRSKLA